MLNILVLSGRFPGQASNYRLSVSLTKDKVDKWAALIWGSIQTRKISSPSLAKPIGYRVDPKTRLFGKFARAQFRHLYTKLYSEVYPAKLPSREKGALIWRHWVISRLTPRAPRMGARPPYSVIHTDAETTNSRIASLRPQRPDSNPRATQLRLCQDPRLWLRNPNEKNTVF